MRGVAPIECVNPRKDKWRVRWNIEEQDGMATYEAEFDRRPTLEEIKTTVLTSYNARIDEAIRSGFHWEETPVWLSAENQFNYKAAFDLAVQTDGANLPVVFKLGTDEKPVYREFTTVDELELLHSRDGARTGYAGRRLESEKTKSTLVCIESDG